MPQLPATSASTRFRITNPRRISGGQLVGAFDLTMPSGTIWLGCKLFNSSGTFWVKPPDAPRVDRDGRALLRADGKRQYDDCVGFVTAERRDRWREQVLVALAVDAPELLEAARTEPPPPPAARPTAAPRPARDDDLNDPIPF